MDRTEDTPQERTRNGANGGGSEPKLETAASAAKPATRTAAAPQPVPRKRRGRTGIVLVILLAGSLAVNWFQYQNQQNLESDLGTAVVAAQAQAAKAQGELAALRSSLGSVNERVASLRDALGELAAATAKELAAADARALRSPQISATPTGAPAVGNAATPVSQAAPGNAGEAQGSRQGRIPIANWIRDWVARARAAWAGQS